MDTPIEQKQPSETSAAPRASNELIRLIRKLRWMGREEEARGIAEGAATAASNRRRHRAREPG